MEAVAKRIGRHEKWRELIEAQEKSGLSQVAFCKQHHLSKSNFVYYKGVIKSKNAIEEHKSKVDKMLPPVFSPIQIKKSDSGTACEIKVILPNGFQCVIPTVADMVQVKRLMEALLSC